MYFKVTKEAQHNMRSLVCVGACNVYVGSGFVVDNPTLRHDRVDGGSPLNNDRVPQVPCVYW